jgi:lysozyme
LRDAGALIVKLRRLAALAALCVSAASCTASSYDALKTASVENMANVSVTYAAPKFGDHDPWNWTGKAPWNYAVHGTDVSKYQGDVDWAQQKAAGISFSFIKATEGGDRVDDMFMRNWAQARQAGVARGAYHFYYFCTSAAAQARWFIRNVPRDSSALPPVLDMEWNHKSPTCQRRPGAKAVQRDMKTFMDMVGAHYGKRPLVYTTPDFFTENRLNEMEGVAFWLRSTAGHPEEKYGNSSWVFWQYTGTGKVPGIKGHADINVFAGSRASWKKWLEANTN